MKKPMTFSVAMRDFFGQLPGQTPAGFLAELKALDATDKAYFSALLTGAGYEITNVSAA